MADQKQGLGIRRKLLLLFFGLGICPLLLVAGGSYFNTLNALEESVRKKAQQQVDQVGTRLAERLTPRLEDIEALTWNHAVFQLYGRNSTPEDLGVYLEQFLQDERRAFLQLAYFDLHGQLLAAYRRPAGGSTYELRPNPAEGAPMRPPGNALLVRNRWLYDYPIAASGTGSAIGADRRGGVMVLSFAQWVLSAVDEERIGLLVADMEVEPFMEEDDALRLLAHRERAMVLARDSDRILSHANPQLLGAEWKNAYGDLGLDVAALSGSGTRTCQLEGEEWLLSYAEIPRPRWLVATLTQPGLITSTLRLSGKVNLVFGLALSLILATAVIVLVGRISASLRQLTEGAEAIAAGDLGQRIELRTRDETRRLADAFNRMSASLQEHVGALRQLNENLEERVAQRTAELEKANEVVQAHNALLERELETAHDMQMQLMPTAHPEIPGFDIAGICRPATHVGGDFFQYFPLPGGRLALALADVTGHGMEAAIPTVLFSGMLDNQMEETTSPEALFSRLNRSLFRNLNRRTFVCFTMGELDPARQQLRLVNGGCPYPYHYVAATGQVAEITLDAFPLGLRQEAQYEQIAVDLSPGDRVVFCSDGIIEAGSEGEEIFGFERTQEAIGRAAGEGLPAPGLIDYLLREVDAFCSPVKQHDDQTIVVLEVIL